MAPTTAANDAAPKQRYGRNRARAAATRTAAGDLDALSRGSRMAALASVAKDAASSSTRPSVAGLESGPFATAADLYRPPLTRTLLAALHAIMRHG